MDANKEMGAIRGTRILVDLGNVQLSDSAMARIRSATTRAVLAELADHDDGGNFVLGDIGGKALAGWWWDGKILQKYFQSQLEQRAPEIAADMSLANRLGNFGK